MRDNETFCINSLQNFYSERAHLHGRTRCKQNETNCEKERDREKLSLGMSTRTITLLQLCKRKEYCAYVLISAKRLTIKSVACF